MAVRGRFAQLPWWARAILIAVFVVLAYLLPYAGEIPGIGPQIVTEGVDWSSALFTMSYFVLLSLGLNVVVGFAGLLDLGYVGFFAVGAYTVALLTSPDSVFPHRLGVAGGGAGGDRGGDVVGSDPGAGRRCGCGATTWRS